MRAELEKVYKCLEGVFILRGRLVSEQFQGRKPNRIFEKLL